MKNLKAQLIRLGYESPELRPHLKPVLDNISASSKVASDVMSLWTSLQNVHGTGEALYMTFDAFDDHGLQIKILKNIVHKFELSVNTSGHPSDVLSRMHREMNVKEIADEFVKEAIKEDRSRFEGILRAILGWGAP